MALKCAVVKCKLHSFGPVLQGQQIADSGTVITFEKYLYSGKMSKA
jgi:hypothetical protein